MIIPPSTITAYSVERVSQATWPPGPWSLVLQTHSDTGSFMWDLSTLCFLWAMKVSVIWKGRCRVPDSPSCLPWGAIWGTQEQGRCALSWKHNTPCHLPEAEGDGDTVLSSAELVPSGRDGTKSVSLESEKMVTEAKMRRNMRIVVRMTKGNKYESSERREGWKKGILSGNWAPSPWIFNDQGLGDLQGN